MNALFIKKKMDLVKLINFIENASLAVSDSTVFFV